MPSSRPENPEGGADEPQASEPTGARAPREPVESLARLGLALGGLSLAGALAVAGAGYAWLGLEVGVCGGDGGTPNARPGSGQAHVCSALESGGYDWLWMPALLLVACTTVAALGWALSGRESHKMWALALGVTTIAGPWIVRALMVVPD